MDQKLARKLLTQTSLSDLTESLTMGLTLEGVAKKAQLLGSRVSGVRSDQPATGLRSKELSKGQEIDRRTWPKSVLCSTPRVSWLEGIAFYRLSFLLAK